MQINIESNRQYINIQSQFNSTIEATIQSISLNISMETVVIGWLEWPLLPLDMLWSSFGYEWSDDRVWRTWIIWRTLKARTWKNQMIWIVHEFKEANQWEVVVVEVGTAACQIFVVALFARHVVIQWISFKSIAKYLIVNEITQLP
jgi:hypothetical protein